MELKDYKTELDEIESELYKNIKEYDRTKFIERLSSIFDMSDLFLDPMYDSFDSIGEKIVYFASKRLFNGVAHFIKTKNEKKEFEKNEKERLYKKLIRMLYTMLEMQKHRIVEDEKKQDEIEKKLMKIIESVTKENGW